MYISGYNENVTVYINLMSLSVICITFVKESVGTLNQNLKHKHKQIVLTSGSNGFAKANDSYPIRVFFLRPVN